MRPCRPTWSGRRPLASACANDPERDFQSTHPWSGRAVLEIGAERRELGAGDFVGLPAAAPPHHLSNPFAEELVYLTGGERSETDVADFPKLGKRLVRVGRKVAVHKLEDAAESPFARFGFTRL